MDTQGRLQNAERLCAMFQERVQTFLDHTHAIEEQVSRGCPPAPEAALAWSGQVNLLRDCYSQLVSLTSQITGSAPEKGTSAGECLQLCVQAACQRRAEWNDFLHVTSNDPQYVQELEPLREMVLSALACPQGSEEPLPWVPLFLQLIKTDTGAAAFDPLLEQVEAALPDMSLTIQRGLLRGKYTLPQSETTPEASLTVSPAEPAVIPPKAPGGEDAAAAAPPAENPEAVGEPVPEEAKTALSSEHSGEDTALEPELLPVLGKWKTAQPNASSFKNELSQMSAQGRFLLPALSHMGALTAEQMGRLMQAMEPNVRKLYTVPIEQTLEALVRKNCLAAYAGGPNGESVYCLTVFAAGSMKKSSIKSYIERSGKFFLNMGTFPLVAARVLPKATLTSLLCRNEQLIQYFQLVLENTPDEHSHVVGGTTYAEGGYNTLLPTPEGPIPVLLCPAGDLPQLTGALLCLRREELEPLPGQVLYSYDGRPWSFAGDGWHILADGGSSAGMPPAPSTETSTGMPPEPSGEAVLEEPIVAPDCIPAPGPAPKGEATPKAETVPAFPQPPAEISQALLERCQGSVKPTDQELQAVIFALLDSGVRRRENDVVEDQLIQAILLARCAGGDPRYPGCLRLFRQLHAATDLLVDPVKGTDAKSRDCTWEHLDALFGGAGADPRTEGLRLAAYLRAMFAPGDANDYNLRRQMKEVFDQYETHFPSFPKLKNLFKSFLLIEDNTAKNSKVAAGSGFTDAVLNYLSGETQKENRLKGLRDKAKRLLSFDTARKLPEMHRTAPKMGELCFGPQSDFSISLQAIVSENDVQEIRSLAEITLSTFCEETGQLDEAKLGEFIDAKWQEANKAAGIKGKAPQLVSRARKAVQKGVEERVELLQEWMSMTEVSLEENSSALKGIWQELRTSSLPAALSAMPRKGNNGGFVLQATLEHLLRKLKSEPEPDYPFADLLRTGQLSLDDKGQPVIDDTLCQVRYFEPWRSCLKHIASSVQGLAAVREEIFTPSSPLLDNLSQGAHIARYLREPDAPQFEIPDEVSRAADACSVRFREELQLDYTYGRVDEQESETLEGLMRAYRDSFFSVGDFGAWRGFLDALRRQAHEYASAHKDRLQRDLTEQKKTLREGERCPLLERAEQLLGEENLAVTEEYINRFIAKEREVPDIIQDSIREPSYFSTFLSKQVFTPIVDTCQRNRGAALRNFGWKFIYQSPPEGWSNPQLNNAKELLGAWPSRQHAGGNADSLGRLFRLMGLEVDGAVTQDQGRGSIECYKVPVRHDRFNKADYRHPIAAFGTQLLSPLRVVCLFGYHTAKQLVDSVCALNLNSIFIVLVDSVIDQGSRRSISQIVHTEKTAGQAPFLVIDQALMLYLATLQQTERLPAMLQCTLPYTIYQPFSEGNGKTADEMFCGRVRELNSITAKNGACIVYGGRQLGKTALLQRAASLGTDPKERRFALFISILGCRDEAAFASAIANEIRDLGLPFPAATDIRSLCGGIRELFQAGKAAGLHLLLDEADNFLQSIAPQEYRPLQPLVDLWRKQSGFKFVLAGLHNVFRAKRSSSPNSILGQLGEPLCIEPLSPVDALQLFSMPLAYLGFQLKSDSGQRAESDKDAYRIETLLTNTNYYPGIVQFFGHALVEALSTQYGKYYSAAGGHPPYTLKREQLGTIMNTGKLNEKIRERIRLTLELDPRYFMLARCIAMLYLMDEDTLGNAYGFSLKEIKGMAESYDIHCLVPLSEPEYTALLDELVQMGILSRFEEKRTYRLRRHNFLGIIGPNLDVLDANIAESNLPEPGKGDASV